MPSARKFSTILGVALLALAPVVAWAQIASGNTYTIGGIDVDVTGTDRRSYVTVQGYNFDVGVRN